MYAYTHMCVYIYIYIYILGSSRKPRLLVFCVFAFNVIAFACCLLACCLLLFVFCLFVASFSSREEKLRSRAERHRYVSCFRYISGTLPLRFRYVSVTFPLRFCYVSVVRLPVAPARGKCKGSLRQRAIIRKPLSERDSKESLVRGQW